MEVCSFWQLLNQYAWKPMCIAINLPNSFLEKSKLQKEMRLYHETQYMQYILKIECKFP